MRKDMGLLCIRLKKIRRIVHKIVRLECIFLHAIKEMIEHCAILPVLLMRAIRSRGVHVEEDAESVTWGTVT